MNSIQWNGYQGHQRTDEELLYSLRWCERHKATISFAGVHVSLRIRGKRDLIRAYDIGDCVKAAIENYGQPE